MPDPSQYAVGQMVRFRFGVSDVVGTIKEDRGPIGINGRRLYSIGFSPESSQEMMIELPATEFELVNDKKNSKRGHRST